MKIKKQLTLRQIKALCKWSYDYGLNEGWRFESRLNEKLMGLFK